MSKGHGRRDATRLAQVPRSCHASTHLSTVNTWGICGELGDAVRDASVSSWVRTASLFNHSDANSFNQQRVRPLRKIEGLL